VRTLTVYCSSSTALEPAYAATAQRLGRAMAERGIALVYGGGGVGLMGALARATKDAGGTVIGIITEQFVALEQGWDGCDELIVVDSMRERKRLLGERGDGFLTLPGGLGTYEELFETIVARSLGHHRKPIGIANDEGYYDPLLLMIEHGIVHRFIRPSVRDLLVIDTDPVRLLDRLTALPLDRRPASAFVPSGGGLGRSTPPPAGEVPR
jgi:uncharacterized protein (TIGR00730 family)